MERLVATLTAERDALRATLDSACMYPGRPLGAVLGQMILPRFAEELSHPPPPPGGKSPHALVRAQLMERAVDTARGLLFESDATFAPNTLTLNDEDGEADEEEMEAAGFGQLQTPEHRSIAGTRLSQTGAASSVMRSVRVGVKAQGSSVSHALQKQHSSPVEGESATRAEQAQGTTFRGVAPNEPRGLHGPSAQQQQHQPTNSPSYGVQSYRGVYSQDARTFRALSSPQDSMPVDSTGRPRAQGYPVTVYAKAGSSGAMPSSSSGMPSSAAQYPQQGRFVSATTSTRGVPGTWDGSMSSGGAAAKEGLGILGAAAGQASLAETVHGDMSQTIHRWHGLQHGYRAPPGPFHQHQQPLGVLHGGLIRRSGASFGVTSQTPARVFVAGKRGRTGAAWGMGGVRSIPAGFDWNGGMASSSSAYRRGSGPAQRTAAWTQRLQTTSDIDRSAWQHQLASSSPLSQGGAATSGGSEHSSAQSTLIAASLLPGSMGQRAPQVSEMGLAVPLQALGQLGTGAGQTAGQGSLAAAQTVEQVVPASSFPNGGASPSGRDGSVQSL